MRETAKSIQQVDQFLLHLVINLAVSGESAAAFRMPRYGGYQVRIFDLLVEVAYKGLPCRVRSCHLI